MGVTGHSSDYSQSKAMTFKTISKNASTFKATNIEITSQFSKQEGFLLSMQTSKERVSLHIHADFLSVLEF